MTPHHLILLVEEPSMEAFLHGLLPRLLPDGCTFEVHPFQGKSDLLGKLPSRLQGYARWLDADSRILVIVDRDSDDCIGLKWRLESAAATARLTTKTAGNPDWRVVNRIAIEELEAWFFGDWDAVRGAFPRVAPNVPTKAKFRDPDAIRGGTWEAFERILQRSGYYKTGLSKVEVAGVMGVRLDTERCRSTSFRKFHEAIVDAVRE